MTKQYLGDAVYVEFDENRRLVLMTSNGYETTNRIVLETPVYHALVDYVERAIKKTMEDARVHCNNIERNWLEQAVKKTMDEQKEHYPGEVINPFEIGIIDDFGNEGQPGQLAIVDNESGKWRWTNP